MTGMKIINCAQNSPEWLQARLGLPTASEFSTVLAKGKSAGAVSLTRRAYLYKLAGEIICGEPAESYTNHHMERGHEREPEIRADYAFLHDVEPQLVGFVRNGNKGASPDSLIGDDGALEIKSKIPARLIECLLRDPSDPPPEHRAQLQGILWVCERAWIDLAIHWPGMPFVTFRVARDNGYIANLSGEVDRFNDELAGLVERVRRYGQPEAQAAA